MIVDLQKMAMDSNTKVSDLLTNAYVVARKLNLKEFEEVINLELNGYDGNMDKLPEYRKVRGQLMASRSPFPGFIPFHIQEPEINDLIRTAIVSKPISELEGYYDGSNDFIIIKLVPEQITFLNEMGNTRGFIPDIHVQRPQIKNIWESVRKIIIEWTIQLENDGIEGKEMSFSKEEKEIAQENLRNYVNILTQN